MSAVLIPGATAQDDEVAALDLCHDAGECAVDEWVEGWVVEKVVGEVNLESLVGADWWCEGVEEVGESWESARGEVAACRKSVS